MKMTKIKKWVGAILLSGIIVIVIFLASILSSESTAKNITRNPYSSLVKIHHINGKLFWSDTSGVLNPLNNAFYWSMDDTLRFSNNILARIRYIDTTDMLNGYMRKGTISKDYYTNSGTVAAGAGNVIFYLTNDKTASGTALYTNVTYVNPVVNDATINYTYGWTISGDKKTLTVNVKGATGVNVALLGLTLLGVPANVANGVVVNVLAQGN